MTEEVELMTWSYLSQLSQVSYKKIVNSKKEMEPKEKLSLVRVLCKNKTSFQRLSVRLQECFRRASEES